MTSDTTNAVNTHSTPNRWQSAMRRYAAAAEAFCARQRQVGERDAPGRNLPASVNDDLNRLAESVCETESRLIEMPAPDLSALRWKLERLLAIDPDGTTSGWHGDYVRQTASDIARLLPA